MKWQRKTKKKHYICTLIAIKTPFGGYTIYNMYDKFA